MRYSGHITSDVSATIVDSRVLQTEERGFDEFAGAQRHVASVFCGDAEFEKIKLI